MLRLADLGAGWKQEQDVHLRGRAAVQVGSLAVHDHGNVRRDVLARHRRAVYAELDVFPTSAQALADYAVQADPKALGCEGEYLRPSFGASTKLVSSRALAAPGIGDRSAARRWVFKAGTATITVDYIAFVRGRVNGGLFALVRGGPLPGAGARPHDGSAAARNGRVALRRPALDPPPAGGTIVRLVKVETEGMLSIGRFARLSGLTVKALRHYDELGILRPAHVDSWTGYRWYEPAQVREAVAVRRLRALRVPLDQVPALLRADGPSLREALAVHRARLEGELVETRQVLTALDRLIEGRGATGDRVDA